LKKTQIIFSVLFILIFFAHAHAEDGYRLWLRYNKINDAALLAQYKNNIRSVFVSGNSATLSVIRLELRQGLAGLLGSEIRFVDSENASVLISKIQDQKLGPEGYSIFTKIKSGKKIIIINANTDIGLQYGCFNFLRMLQTQQSIENLNIVSVPLIKLRILNHWDNLNRSVERGYAGISIWNWHTLPDYIDQRYIDYARANASIGINGTVLTNVNANALVLSKPYLDRVTALANTFRPYGIKVYLTARFSSPIELGGLKTADPLDKDVQQWWKDKAKEIYRLIPDFGGFLVKANSEGQPGPQNYNRTHADGANMLADAVAPFSGIIMWRAFVYDVRVQKADENFDSAHIDTNAPTIASTDRFKQAYKEFKPLDGKFRENVLVQIKSGPIDFQPREPFSPLFGAMPKTPEMMEFQLTQEYLGQGTHLVYEAPLFKEVLDADTYAKGKGSTVAKIIDGSLYGHALSGMAAVSNIGNDRNWTGHLFAQSNWYTVGRLAWNENLTGEQIADEWIRQTFSNSKIFVDSIKQLMLDTREVMVNYMTPLGLHHIMANGHHYGPAPWSDNLPRADWNPVYYHRADDAGIGFDRTAAGSDALAQYNPEVRKLYEDINTCDEKFLLWFHHVSWAHKMKSGRTLWDELCNKYNDGVWGVRKMQATWNKFENTVDKERFEQVKMLLNIQEKEAVWWRNACLLYFQTFSKTPIPANIEKPDHTLEYYKSLSFPYAPGNGK
jgi:alpha-glucuronidase